MPDDRLEWLVWLEARLGTRQWVVTPRLTERMHARGYTVAISQKRFTALQAEYKTEVAAINKQHGAFSA